MTTTESNPTRGEPAEEEWGRWCREESLRRLDEHFRNGGDLAELIAADAVERQKKNDTS